MESASDRIAYDGDNKIALTPPSSLVLVRRNKDLASNL